MIPKILQKIIKTTRELYGEVWGENDAHEPHLQIGGNSWGSNYIMFLILVNIRILGERKATKVEQWLNFIPRNYLNLYSL